MIILDIPDLSTYTPNIGVDSHDVPRQGHADRARRGTQRALFGDRLQRLRALARLKTKVQACKADPDQPCWGDA